MRITFQLTIVLAICFAFVSIKSGYSFPDHNLKSSPTCKFAGTQIAARDSAAMDKITAELFEIELDSAARKICKQDFLVNKKEDKFILECERYGIVTMQDKKDNTGKYGTCKFRVSFYKQTKKNKKYKGYVDIVLKGIIEIRSDESLQFFPTEYEYSTINESIYQWKRSNIHEGVVYVLNWAPVIIDAIKR